MTARLSGVVLAAGAGERMGGPKALLVIGGEPLARAHAERFRASGCGRVVIVTRGELVAKLAGGAIVVASSAPDPAGSLAVGLEALAAEEDETLLITPVDAWPVRPETIGRLVDAVNAGAEAATPRHGGKGGHPVAIRARALATQAASPRPLRDVLAALGSARVHVEVDDPSILVDLDTPEDVVARTGELPRFA
jgi:molybdenum cofactor cytidylyltransferase